MNKNEAEAVIKETIEYANKEIEKNKKKSAKTTVIAACASAVLVILLFAAGFFYANHHYSYIPYEESGITCANNEMRTTKNYAQFVGVNVTYNGENIEFLFLCSNPVSRHTDPKRKTIIEDFNVSNGSVTDDKGNTTECYVDKVYYLSESAINKLPFFYSSGYMPLDLIDADLEKDVPRWIEGSELIWSRQ